MTVSVDFFTATNAHWGSTIHNNKPNFKVLFFIFHWGRTPTETNPSSTYTSINLENTSNCYSGFIPVYVGTEFAPVSSKQVLHGVRIFHHKIISSIWEMRYELGLGMNEQHRRFPHYNKPLRCNRISQACIASASVPKSCRFMTPYWTSR